MNEPSQRHARIIVLEDVELEAKLVVRTLADHGFSDVVHTRDVDGAVKALDDQLACIVLTDLELGSKANGDELIRRVRNRKTGSYVYVIVLTAHGTPERSRTCFEAGADDFIVKPLRRDELIARVRAGERIVRLERSLYNRANELEAALKVLDKGALIAALARAATKDSAGGTTNPAEAMFEACPWDTLRDAIGATLTGFVGTPFTSTQTVDLQAAVVGEVCMAEASKQLELRVSVLVGGSSMRKLAGLMFGDDTDFQAGCDLVLEMGNLLMGILKSTFGGKGYAFTGGLPTSPKVADVRSSYDAQPVRQCFAFASDGISLEVWVAACEKRNMRILGSTLREGMVVAEDIRDGKGMLLVRGGSRLTQTTADRLAQLIPRLEVVVSNVAA